MNNPSENLGESEPSGAGTIQPWIKSLWQWLAAFMTFAALLWNIDFFEWFGFAFVEEQYYAFIMGLALAVVFLSVRINREPDGHVPWYDLLLAALSLAVLTYISFNFLYLREFWLGWQHNLCCDAGSHRHGPRH